MANQGSISQPNPAAEGYGREDLSSELWMECAGPQVDVPKRGDRVLYFPQAHLEQLEASTNQDVTTTFNLPSKILCHVVDIELGAEQDTDEVYAQITLLPKPDQNEPKTRDSYRPEPPRPTVPPSCKVLTPSDISSGELYLGTSGDKCLPPLDMKKPIPTQDLLKEPIPTQVLLATDLHGQKWEFTHVCRDKKKKHLLTRGWSKFVKSKRLEAGDTVVFLRGESGEFRVGVRRATRQQSSMPSSAISSQSMHLGVLYAASYAVNTHACFFVKYKPRTSRYIIGLNEYLETVNNKLAVGLRFKMAFEGEDSSVRRFTGIIVGSEDLSPQWEKSMWRSLKVQWDEPAPIASPDRVSPWDIELLPPSISSSQVQPIITKNKSTRPPAEIPDREMRPSKRKLLGRLAESSQQTGETPQEMQLQTTCAPPSEEIAEGGTSLARMSERDRVDGERTSAAGATAEPFSDCYRALPRLPLTPYYWRLMDEEAGDSPELTSPLAPGMQFSLEAARAAEEEAEAQAQHRTMCNLVNAAEQCLDEGIQPQFMAMANARADLAKEGTSAAGATAEPISEDFFNGLPRFTSQPNVLLYEDDKGIQPQFMATANEVEYVQHGIRHGERLGDLEHRVSALEEENNSLRDEVKQVKGELGRLQEIMELFHKTASMTVEKYRALEESRGKLKR